MNGETGLRAGRWSPGGMWVYGLCKDCNSSAGGIYDKAYGDFARSLLAWYASSTARSEMGAQAVSMAPGRVARSVLSGMLGISPHIRVLHPQLAAQVWAGGPVRLPGGLALRVAVYLGGNAQLAGPMLSGFTDGTGRAVHSLASVTFAPLSWALVTSDTGDVLAESGWADATEWLRYADDRESVDLRYLHPRGIARTTTVLHAPGDDYIQMYSSEIATIMVGRLRS